MCYVIAIDNQKGGTGKTTVTKNLGIGLCRMGKKVLAIDLDPQGDLTGDLGFFETRGTTKDVMETIINEGDIDPAYGLLYHDEGMDLLPADINLAIIESLLVTLEQEQRDYVLRKYVELQRERYDYILIDCMTFLGRLTINALSAADGVIIPVQAQNQSIRGLQNLIWTIGNIQKHVNSGLTIEGILFNMVDTRTNFEKGIVDLLRKAYGSKLRVFAEHIPKSVRAEEISPEGISIFQYEPEGRVARAYEALVKEVLQDERG